MAQLIKQTTVGSLRQKLNALFVGSIQQQQQQLQQRRWEHHSHDSNECFDLIVVGGGIIGMASAREMLIRHPEMKIAVVEKENRLAFHQSGHNSGVIHAGIYYKPGTLKAKLCVEGLRLMYNYCDSKGIPYKRNGKLIVATNEIEVERLCELESRGRKNQVPGLQVVDCDEIEEIEPYCRGIKAIWSPYTGIIDYICVTESYGEDFTKAGGKIFLNYKVDDFAETTTGCASDYPITVYGTKQEQALRTRHVLTCGGLQSDILAEKTGCASNPRIVPFRGEYLLLAEDKAHMVKGNIYPVPDPRFPFLGVHFTPRMNGDIWLGPNAVLALKREGYTWGDINIAELFDALRYPGFLKMAPKYMGFGLSEMAKSVFPSLQVKSLQKYIPCINSADIRRGPAGVRAQAMELDGSLVDDFVFDSGSGTSALSKQVLHCRNAPSPGATSSLAIAKMIASTIEKKFEIGDTSDMKLKATN